LSRGTLTLVTTPRVLLTRKLDATALGRGGSRFQLNSDNRETPPGQARGIWRLWF
jgi:hypothetical protein